MSEAFEPPLCFVVGIGPGTGLAVARKFAAEGYRLAFSSRDRAKLDGYEKEIPGSRGYVYDVRDVAAAERVVAELRAGQGAPHVVVYNTGPGAFVDIDRAEVEDLQSAWEINTRGLFAITKALLPDLRAQRGANLIVMGATASWRGGAKALPFASAKASQRSLSESLARRLGPERIHVSYLILDGMIDTPEVLAMMKDAPPETFLSSAGIADAAFKVANQPESAWTFELDLRPFGERW
jgi:NAD(P)-dependent dehydrogenase (short-subunit alcohol dehydrogenase family)